VLLTVHRPLCTRQTGVRTRVLPRALAFLHRVGVRTRATPAPRCLPEPQRVGVRERELGPFGAVSGASARVQVSLDASRRPRGIRSGVSARAFRSSSTPSGSQSTRLRARAAPSPPRGWESAHVISSTCTFPRPPPRQKRESEHVLHAPNPLAPPAPGPHGHRTGSQRTCLAGSDPSVSPERESAHVFRPWPHLQGPSTSPQATPARAVRTRTGSQGPCFRHSFSPRLQNRESLHVDRESGHVDRESAHVPSPLRSLLSLPHTSPGYQTTHNEA
jgi:hypothetical protein